jgi:hypothetical protein
MGFNVGPGQFTTRFLLEHSQPIDDTYTAAETTAAAKIGTAATHILWTQGVDPDNDTYIAGALHDIDLRFEQSEPGNERLLVRVPCPNDPDCRHAHDDVEDTGSLIAILDGATETEGNICCFYHN